MVRGLVLTNLAESNATRWRRPALADATTTIETIVAALNELGWTARDDARSWRFGHRADQLG